MGCKLVWKCRQHNIVLVHTAYKEKNEVPIVNREMRKEHKDFENEVRRIARGLWPDAEFSGASVVEGREIDGVFETEDCIHVVEATTSQGMEKARQDVSKIQKLLTKLQGKSGTRAVRGWFVTRNEPTGDQRKVTEKYRKSINVLSFSQFQARLIDSKSYISVRDAYHFGSVRDPATGEHDKDLDIEYVALDLVRLDSREVIPLKNIVTMIQEGNTIVLLGDYGAGKSMTLRELYRELRKIHLSGKSSTFPIYLNLRDHYGQTEPAEILGRHAHTIGFSNPTHLVRAWRAGYVHLIVDGFDEISTLAIQGLWRKLKDNRFRAMEGVRRLIGDHPSGPGLLLAGREHFFDSTTERHNALKLPRYAVEFSLTEFTDEQIHAYLKRMGLSGTVPSWLPSRPLLLGYLAAKGLLEDVANKGSIDSQIGPCEGWDVLLDSISAREAEIEAGIDGSTVRRILERLASKVRLSQGGVGSLSPDTVMIAFDEICGYKPDERGMLLLQRLPGLGVDRVEEESRAFVDEEFADACKAGDFVSFVENPYDFPENVLTDVGSAIGDLGIGIAALKARSRGYSESKINAALVRSQSADSSYMMADIVRLLSEMNMNVEKEAVVDGVLIPEFELGVDSDLSKIRFRDCFFFVMELDSAVDVGNMPFFQQCFVEELEGRVSMEDIPEGRFDKNCIIDRFIKTTETTANVLTLDLPLGVRVCLTVLKKLYEQRGSGRKENALHRGLDSRARRYVPDVLSLLQSEKLALPDKSRGTTIWRPDRSQRARVGRMLAAPSMEKDAVLIKSGHLVV